MTATEPNQAAREPSVNGAAAPTPAEDAVRKGRDQRGRFSKGNKGGPGNPFSRQVAHMRKVMLECVSEDDLRRIVAGVVEQAREGDLAAAKLVLSYVVGKPVETVDPDRVDVEEFRLLQEESCAAEQVGAVINSVPAGLACEILEGVVPVQALAQRQQFVHGLLAADSEEEEPEEGEEEEAQAGHEGAAPPPSAEEIVAYQRQMASTIRGCRGAATVAHEAAGADSKRRETDGKPVDGGPSGAPGRPREKGDGGARPGGAVNGVAARGGTKGESGTANLRCPCGG